MMSPQQEPKLSLNLRSLPIQEKKEEDQCFKTPRTKFSSYAESSFKSGKQQSSFPAQYLVFKIPLVVLKFIIVGAAIHANSTLSSTLVYISSSLIYLVAFLAGCFYFLTWKKCVQKVYLSLLGTMSICVAIELILYSVSPHSNNLQLFGSILTLLSLLIEACVLLILKYKMAHNPFKKQTIRVSHQSFTECVHYFRKRDKIANIEREKEILLQHIAERVNYPHFFRTTLHRECPCCLNEYDYCDEIVILKMCGHHMHKQCLKQWFQCHSLRCPRCETQVLRDMSQLVFRETYD